jgi:hypothetical protein
MKEEINNVTGHVAIERDSEAGWRVCHLITVGAFCRRRCTKTPAGDYSINTLAADSIEPDRLMSAEKRIFKISALQRASRRLRRDRCRLDQKHF